MVTRVHRVEQRTDGSCTDFAPQICRGSQSNIQMSRVQHIHVRELTISWGKYHPQELEKTIIGIHRRSGIAPLPTSQTEESHNSQGFE